MKKIYSARNPIEARLLAETLCREGISAAVREETMMAVGEGSSVWIENPSDQGRALALIDEMAGPAEAPSSPVAAKPPGGLRGGFLLGLVLGAVVSYFGARGWSLSEPSSTQEWDSNGDGEIDTWDEYSPEGFLTNSKQDLNFDGRVDSWFRYDPPGVLALSEYDQDFDGKPDLWESFRQGAACSYKADNDRDGVVDEWGKVQAGLVTERSWSFAGDGIVDKRAFYSKGRKRREEIDLDRDGVFDQAVSFDEFERPMPR